MADHLGKVAIVNLYKEAQVQADMDSEVDVMGNGHSPFTVIQTLEYIAFHSSLTLPPRMKRVDREQYLLDTGRAGYIEYLGVMGD